MRFVETEGRRIPANFGTQKEVGILWERIPIQILSEKGNGEGK